MAEVSSTRLYLGNLPRDVTKEDIVEHFKTHGTGNITEVKLMNGFGFIEYDDALDAADVVPDGSDLKGNRLTVQFARGTRPREAFAAPHERSHPRPRRTAFRMQLQGLAEGTSWQDLKDFARRSGLDVVYSEVGRERDGKGFVEFESAADLRSAVEKLENQEFKGATVHCTPDPQPDVPRDRLRSRSPPPHRRGYDAPPRSGYYDQRGPPPPRGYSPREGYRHRSPGPRRDDYYESRPRYRSPPRGVRGPPPVDEGYAHPPRGYRDDYGAPPPRPRYEEPYGNGYERGGGRPRSPGRGYGGGYEERGRYW